MINAKLILFIVIYLRLVRHNARFNKKFPCLKYLRNLLRLQQDFNKSRFIFIYFSFFRKKSWIHSSIDHVQQIIILW